MVAFQTCRFFAKTKLSFSSGLVWVNSAWLQKAIIGIARSLLLWLPLAPTQRGLGKASKQKREKSGQADRLGQPPLPLPRSGQENVKNSQQVVIFGVILPFYKGQNGSKFSQNRSGQAGRGWPPLPPPKRSAWPLYRRFFFWILPLGEA